MKRLGMRALGASALGLLTCAASAAVISPELSQELERRHAGESIPVIIQLADRVDFRQHEVRSRRLRNNTLFRALKDKADKTQQALNPLLQQYGAVPQKQLWLINAVTANVPAWAIEQLARNPAVGRIQYDAIVPFTATTKAAATTAGWNLNAMHVPEVWALGATGNGVVVASMDTGVDVNHPDLVKNWRGGTNSWFDPYNQHATPYDFSGHGTQTMGLMAGGAASGTGIGVAPDARWIAAKIYNDAGQGTLSQIHLAFQWLLDPDGNPATIDAPDVVNASWGLAGMAPGTCNLEFNEDIAALTAAGIAVVFAAGNDGPALATSSSPANNPASYAVGAVDEALAVASLSSRGPSGCDGLTYPKVVAPGVNVVTSDLSFGGLPVYATVSGTSFAAPHVAGTMALLAGAFPAATVAELRNTVNNAAQELGNDGADNTFGYGLTNALAAHTLLSGTYSSGSAPNFTSAPPTAAIEGRVYSYQPAAADPDGDTFAFSLDTAPAGMSIQNGLISWTPTHAQVGSHPVTLRVTDSTNRFSLQSFLVAVAAVNNPPVATNDTYSVVSGSTLNVAAPGLLANDSDPDANAMTAVLATNPAHGTVALNSNGSFSYVPAAGYVGADAFTYRASDGQAASNTATVTVNVTAATANKPPVAGDDSYIAPARRNSNYIAQVFNILANDKDPDGTINASTVTIMSAPTQGGTVTVNANGRVSYIPALRFAGTETFTYRVKDNSGNVSNTATVKVTVY